MKFQMACALLALFFAQTVGSGFSPQAGARNDRVAAFSFGDVKYFYRYTQNDQHEYTLDGQEDLKSWTDMVTILIYPRAKDAEGLAATASAVLENYKANKASVVRTDSVPRTRDKPAEHLIVVLFGRPAFMEAAFARFRMHNGIGSAVVYSHRIYGKKAADEMGVWLQRNGPLVERNLMTWDAMPKLVTPK